MTVVDQITETIRRLPLPVQQEVLDFAESLAEQVGKDPSANGHSDEHEKLEVMRQAMTDRQFVADLQEISEDFRHVDGDEVKF